MSAQNSSNHPYLQMPETSRTRSDSLEESGSQQDRKRPRLSSSSHDQLSSEEALTDFGCPPPEVPPATVAAPHSTHSRPVASSSQTPARMPTSPGGLPSKVTINTRTLQTPSSSQLQSTPPQSPDTANTSERSTTENSGLTEAEASEIMVAAAPDAISISSSPSRSPEIEAAELEDIDQPAAETRWTPITRFSSNFNRQEFPPTRHVHRTFPFASANCDPGKVHELIPQFAKVFHTGTVASNLSKNAQADLFLGSNNDSSVFLQLKQWLSAFVQNARKLPASFLHEESEFWSDFPEIVTGLLKRQYETTARVRRSLYANHSL